MNRILITGGTGFVGKAIVKALRSRDKDAELHVVSRSTGAAGVNGEIFHEANLLDEKQVGMLMQEVAPTHLVHTAWCAEHGTYWKDQANFEWLSAGLNIAKQFKQSNGSRCVFIGTSAEYDWSTNEPLDENTSTLVPQGLYGGCKLALYWALKRYAEQESISLLWARLFNPFGPGEDARRLIPKICRRLLNNETIQFDSATALRDFMFVDDVGEAIAHSLLTEVSGAVNIASGEAVSIRWVLETLAAALGKSEAITFDDQDVNAALVPMVTASVNRLRGECGWQPAYTLSQRLEQTANWWRSNVSASVK